jgi:hypothetical protein
MAVTPIFKFDDDQIIEALEATRCNFTQAALFLAKRWDRPCHRNYVARVVKKRPHLIEFVREYRASAIDKAEDNIFKQVLDGDLKASALVVRTLGKKRGWVPRSETAKMLSPKDQLMAIAGGEIGRKRTPKAPPNKDGRHRHRPQSAVGAIRYPIAALWVRRRDGIEPIAAWRGRNAVARRGPGRTARTASLAGGGEPWGGRSMDRGRAADGPTAGRRGGPDGRDRSGRADIAADGTATDDATLDSAVPEFGRELQQARRASCGRASGAARPQLARRRTPVPALNDAPLSSSERSWRHGEAIGRRNSTERNTAKRLS